jgi:DNA-binding XRE family transcriptional regulator
MHIEAHTRSSLDVQLPRLREHRQRRALSQQELANLTGLSRTTIIKLEGGRNAWPKTQRKLAKALHVKPEDLT